MLTAVRQTSGWATFEDAWGGVRCLVAQESCFSRRVNRIVLLLVVCESPMIIMAERFILEKGMN